MAISRRLVVGMQFYTLNMICPSLFVCSHPHWHDVSWLLRAKNSINYSSAWCLKFNITSGVDRFKRPFAHLEEHYGNSERNTPLQRQHVFLPRERVCAPKDESKQQNNIENVPGSDAIGSQNGTSRSNYSTRSLLKSASISASKCVVVKQNKDPERQSRR
ncbi:mitogen-activated protein kinase 9-like isoform X3 [Vigna unguiculata]|uniref:mitogen-activated protein kinase 9-like isoform X3 n=1 Tax=Vigna unguiculata TaxID=3917 RepID=UPI00101641E0|nr:mitogen-activated protein kinase 9-like isoform X3 [Vigna unguiculata]